MRARCWTSGPSASESVGFGRQGSLDYSQMTMHLYTTIDTAALRMDPYNLRDYRLAVLPHETAQRTAHKEKTGQGEKNFHKPWNLRCWFNNYCAHELKKISINKN